MKNKANLEPCVYVVVIVLCLIAMFLVATSGDLFSDTKVVYRVF